MIHVCTPYRTDKNLGKAYNEAFSLIGDEDWLCVHDWDFSFLLPDSISHLYGYIERFPNVDAFTCYCNRSHISSHQQMLNGKISNDTDYMHHISLAIKQKEKLYQATEIKGNISGYMMLLSKRLWKEIPFAEDLKCLGVDSLFSVKLRQKGKNIYRMDGLYGFHQYRMVNGTKDKSHLL